MFIRKISLSVQAARFVRRRIGDYLSTAWVPSTQNEAQQDVRKDKAQLLSFAEQIQMLLRLPRLVQIRCDFFHHHVRSFALFHISGHIWHGS